MVVASPTVPHPLYSMIRTKFGEKNPSSFLGFYITTILWYRSHDHTIHYDVITKLFHVADVPRYCLLSSLWGWHHGRYRQLPWRQYCPSPWRLGPGAPPTSHAGEKQAQEKKRWVHQVTTFRVGWIFFVLHEVLTFLLTATDYYAPFISDLGTEIFT